MDDSPVAWVKAKYLEPKTRGRYKGGTNSSSKTKTKRKKTPQLKPLFETVMVIRSTGKIAWVKRPVVSK